jgi:hypothetical protein
MMTPDLNEDSSNSNSNNNNNFMSKQTTTKNDLKRKINDTSSDEIASKSTKRLIR